MEDSLLKRHMIAVRDRYNGDWVIPLTEIEDEPQIEPPTPALVADAIDSTAMRACSIHPGITVPALNPAAKSSIDRAARRRRAYYGSWHRSKLPLKLKRSTRHLCGYGTNVLGVVPYFAPNGEASKDFAQIECRDPLTAYPDESAPEEIRTPVNIGFIYPRSPDWIITHYPEARDYMWNYHSDLWDVFEWVDDEHIYIGILGPRQSWGQPYNAARGLTTSGKGPMFLRGWANRAGLVPYVCPGRVTLDRIAGQVTKMIGVVDMYSKLMALEAVAAEKAVFADRYIIGHSNEDITLVGGTWQDGRTGQVNIVKGAQGVGNLVSQLNPQTFAIADRLAEAIRQSTGNPGVFSGSMQGNIRSGQTITQLGNYAIDPRVQEVQEIIEYQLAVVNECIHETIKGYWPRQKFHFFSGWPTDVGYVDFQASKDFEDPANVVAYGFTGADLPQISIAIGQLMQMKLMDRHQAMTLHPMVKDADRTEQAVVEEAITDAALTAFLAQAQQGSLAAIDLLNVLKHFKEDHDIISAVNKAQSDAQKRQATQAPPPGPDQSAAPETQPGLEQPGMSGVEQPPGPGGGPPGGAAALIQALAARAGQPGGPPPGPLPQMAVPNA